MPDDEPVSEVPVDWTFDKLLVLQKRAWAVYDGVRCVQDWTVGCQGNLRVNDLSSKDIKKSFGELQHSLPVEDVFDQSADKR